MPENYISEIKLRAKEINRTSKPSPFLAALVFVAVTMILGTLSSNLLVGNITESGMRSYMNYFMNGNAEKALEYAQSFAPSRSSSILNVIIQLVQEILSAGFIIFTLNTVRRTGEACLENLLDGFGLAGKVLFMYVVKALIIGALSLLLVFPGIIAAYKYSQSLYILLDNPEYSVIDCLKLSKQMMEGHKMERFKLGLSFLGWIILEMFVPVAEVYVLPYMETSRVLYYDRLRTFNFGPSYYDDTFSV